MTEEFLKKVMKANEKAIIAYKNQDSKFLNDLEKNKKYADMYLELVLSFIEVFNYRKGTFDIQEITKDLSQTIGYPENINVYINEKGKLASIRLHYKRNNSLRLDGLPEFIDKNLVDLDILNEILNKNGIQVKADLWDGGDRGLDDYIIYFDASILLTTRKELLQNSEIERKRILGI